MIKDTYEKNKKEIDILSVGLVTKTKERIKNLDRYLPTSLLRIKTQVRPQNWQLPNDVYAWQGLKIARFFTSFQRCYLILPWYKIHTSQVADFQIWDKALSDDELLKVIAIILFCKNEVGSKYRIVNHWRTLCENQLIGQYFSIFQWSKDSNGSPTSQTRPGVNCAEVSNPQATTV